MKTLFFIAISLLLSSNIIGQFLEVNITHNKPSEIIINDLLINKKTKIEKLVNILREASKKTTYPNGETSYFYEDNGLVVFTKDNAIKGLGLNFNWDGDEKFPEKTFNGKLTIGATEIGADTKKESIEKINSIPFTCPFPSLCASTNRNAKVNCTVAYKELKITQVVFILK